MSLPDYLRETMFQSAVGDGAADPGGDELASVAGVRRMFARVADAIAATGRAIESVSRFTDDLKAEHDRLADEQQELRAMIGTLSNRIESTNRVLSSRTDHLA